MKRADLATLTAPKGSVLPDSRHCIAHSWTHGSLATSFSMNPSPRMGFWTRPEFLCYSPVQRMLWNSITLRHFAKNLCKGMKEIILLLPCFWCSDPGYQCSTSKKIYWITFLPRKLITEPTTRGITTIVISCDFALLLFLQRLYGCSFTSFFLLTSAWEFDGGIDRGSTHPSRGGTI